MGLELSSYGRGNGAARCLAGGGHGELVRATVWVRCNAESWNTNREHVQVGDSSSVADAAKQRVSGLFDQVRAASAHHAGRFPLNAPRLRTLGVSLVLGVSLAASAVPAAAQDHSMSPGPQNVAPPASGAASSAAADVRVALGRLLGEHALLAIVTTQKGLDGAADFEAWANALDANSVEVSQQIGSVFGPDVEATFLESWRNHIRMFVDYTVGLASDDTAKSDAAVAELTEYIDAFGQYLADATGLPADAVKSVLTDHVMQLKSQLDAYAAGEYETTWTTAREAYAHMWMLGGTLGDAIVARFPDQFPSASASVGVAADDLRAGLDQLLAEHAFLAAIATQKGFAGASDFEAAAAALDANTVDISAAIGSVFGEEVEAEFLPSWRSHVGLFVDYTVGLASNDTAAQAEAVAQLTAYIDAFGQYLADAAGLPADAVKASLADHVGQLKGQLDAYAVEDFAGSLGQLREAFAHMVGTGDVLASGIVARFPDMFGA
jgi:hypothetical protein